VIPGDTLDFRRVQRLEPQRLLLLAAEMRAPGRGWLQSELVPLAGGHILIVQTTLWDPVGLYGRLYWYALWPMHELIFRGMIRGISRETACRKPGAERL
jgi:hypothetical protein